MKAFFFVILICFSIGVVAVAGPIPAVLVAAAGTYILVFVAKEGPNLSGYDGLAANGVPARGIILQVSSVATSLPGGLIKVRSALIDVEVPGQEPFDASVDVMMPANLSADVIPGATMELRIHPKDSSRIAIVGPGVGFVGAPQLGGPGPRQGAS